MAGIKISDLPAVVTPALTDVFPIDQGAVTYKESNQQLLSLFQANGAALTKTDDTNVTMTLGGSASTSLLNAASITLGWTGNLAVGRGGTGNTTFTPYSVLCAGATATGSFQNVVGLGNAGEQLTSNGAGLLPTWQASGAVTPAALTRVDDTNVTLTLGGTPSTALLQATSITAGWAGTLSGTRGGTGVNNGSFTATYGGNLSFASSFTTSGAFAVTQTYTGITNVTFPTSGTLATTSQIPTGAALTKADDTNVTLTLGGSPTTALINAASITAGWTGQLGLTRGGTAASLTASTGGIVYSGASALAILSGTATAGQIIRSGANAAPTWSTSTYPATNAINTLLYASAANVMSALATANSGFLVTDSGGIPSISSTVPAFTTSSITFSPTTGGIVGTTTNDNAAAGKVGEVISSAIAAGSQVAVTPSGTTVNVTSISLTAGDWDVSGTVYCDASNGSTTITNFVGGITTVSATLPLGAASINSSVTYVVAPSGTSWLTGTSGVPSAPVSPCRISVSATTTVYLVSRLFFAVSTAAVYGSIIARRVR